MIILNSSLLLSSTTTTTTTIETTVNVNSNSTIEIDDTSSYSTIITIIILSILSLSGWIFMSYALFGRSEAYRSKPDDQFDSISPTNNPHTTDGNDFFGDF